MAVPSFPALHHHNCLVIAPYTNLSWEKHHPWYLSGSEEHSYQKKSWADWNCSLIHRIFKWWRKQDWGKAMLEWQWEWYPWDQTCVEINPWEPAAKMMYRLSWITSGWYPIEMLHKHLWVVYVLSDSCSVTALWDCCTIWRSGWFCKHPPEDPPGGKVAWAVPWPGQPPARFSTFGALIWAQPLPANTGLHMADSCLSHWGQSKWCMAGDDWKGHETSSYQLVTCAGRQQASNLAPFYGSASPASAPLWVKLPGLVLSFINFTLSRLCRWSISLWELDSAFSLTAWNRKWRKERK